MRSTLSVMGLYEYDSTLFDLMQIPARVDKGALITNLLAELAELEVVYPDPQTMKTLIGAWSGTMAYRWTTLYETEHFEYNPIWNKDGTYKETETRDLKRTDQGTTEGSSKSNGASEGEELTDVSAFDTSGYSNRNRTKTTGSEKLESTNKGSASSSGTDTGTIVHERIEQGNIGVTSTQQLIKEQRDLADFSIYRIIINDFKARFCILIY